MKFAMLMMAACCATVPAMAASPAATDGPALDLDIEYYTRVMTPEGVTREARYTETMIRRPGHVWVARVLPKNAIDHHDDANSHKHKEFNHVVLPHHVMLENNKVKVEYIDVRSKAVVAIPPSEYANVNFDGSWGNAFFLFDPTVAKAIPLSAKRTAVPGAQWREREKNGTFERVLWDERRQIPLVIESGDKASTFFRRVLVTARPTRIATLPWQNLNGYAQKEFSDYLD